MHWVFRDRLLCPDNMEGLWQRYKRSAKPLAHSSTTTCANQTMSSFFWYKDGGHIVRH